MTSGGGVVCWGYNAFGQLGDGTTTQRTTPVAVSGLSSGVSAMAAGWYHTCAVTSGGGAKCWGANGTGQLGDGSTTYRLTPVAVSGLSSGVSAMAASETHTCAVTSGGGVACWGLNSYGQLGDGTTTNRLTPVVVSDPNQVSGSASTSLAVADATLDAASGSFSVPVDFSSGGASIASVGFSLDYDESCLSYDSYDGIPTGFVEAVSHDAGDTDGELDISIYDATTPIATLSDGTLLSITFNVDAACITSDGSTTDVSVNFSSAPAATFGDPNGDDVTGTTSGGTLTLTFNAAPSDIALSPSSVNENEPSGTVVGSLSTTDLDSGDSHSYSLVSGTGDSDNASFTIDGNQLKTAESFDFEAKSSYSVRVQTDDGGLNGTFAKQLTITVTDVYEAPAGIDFSASGGGDDGDPNTLDIDENKPSGSTIATFGPSNPDTGSSYTFELVTGTGDDDNGSFIIVGNELQTTEPLDAEKSGGYTIRVRITDDQGNSYEQIFVITVNNVNGAATAQDDILDPLVKVLVGTESYNIDVLANDSDPENDTLTVASVTQPAAGSATNNSTNVAFTAPGTNGTSTFTYQASDGSLNSGDATVTVYHVADDLRGDCNGNGSVTAADFIAIVLEIFDAGSDPLYSGNPAWWRIFDGGYAGSPRGCDANGSENGAGNDSDSVTIADISCAVLVFFGNTSCTGGTLNAPTAARQAATLSLQTVQNGRSVNVRL